MGPWNVEDYGLVANRSCWAMFAITAFVVALRIITRIHFGRGKLGGLGADDAVTVFCVVIFMVTCIFVSVGTGWGLGRHQKTIPPAHIPEALKWSLITNSVLIWTFSLPKFAIIAILKRILNYGTKTTILFWGLALSSQACILATSVWWFKQCTPVEYGWNRTIPGKCDDTNILADLGYFTSAYSAFLDVFFAAYPIPFIMRLHMPLRGRIAVSTSLGLSSLSFIVSVYKLAIFGQVFEILAEDPTYPVPFLDILGLAEGCILLVCSSLPTLGPLFRLARGKLSTVDRSQSNTRGHAGASGHSHGLQSASRWRAHKLDDVEHHSGMGSSIDDIPLVSSSPENRSGQGQIFKTVEFGVVATHQHGSG